MHLWRIDGGRPSLADALLVTGGPITAIFAAVQSFDPVLNFFEPQGTLFLCLGYALIFLSLGLCIAAVALPIWRIQKLIREEIRFPRMMFVIATPTIVMIASHLPMLLSFRYVTEHRIPLTLLFYSVPIAVIGMTMVAYLVVASAATRLPVTVNRWTMYFTLGLSGLGVATKAAALFLRK